jgi:hypothetical protein
LDFDKNIVYETNEEMLAVTTTTSIDRSINVPENTPLGDYILLGKIVYGNATAESFDTFKVVSTGAALLNKLYFMFIFLLILLVAYVFIRIGNKGEILYPETSTDKLSEL